MRDSEDHMQHLMDALPLLICYVDRDLRYRFNNRLYEHWIGMSAVETLWNLQFHTIVVKIRHQKS